MTCKILKTSLLSCFYIAVLLDGLQRFSGLFVVELLKSKKETHENAAIPFIFSWAIANIVAPFSNILIDSKYSECLVLFGVILSATGAALCILDTNITTLTVFWGFIFGSGYGLASPHLSRRLETANSCKLSYIFKVTPSVGVIIMPFFLSMLIPRYGLQGSCLIFSGIILNYLPLALAAAYNAEINIPNIKWRVRKKSNQYIVSKQEGVEIVSAESFSNSLEPDLILKISRDKTHNEIKKDSPTFFTREIFPTGRKRSETRGNDLKSLDSQFLLKHNGHPQVTSEIDAYEKNRKLFERSFCNKDLIREGIEHKVFKKTSSVNLESPHGFKTLEKNILNISKCDLSLKNEMLPKISEFDNNGTVSENVELKNHCLESDTIKISPALTLTCVENTTSVLNDDNNALHNNESCKKEKVSFRLEPKENSIPSQSHNVKLLDAETLQLSPQVIPIFSIPIDIKVHVEEYTFGIDDEHLNEDYDSLQAQKFSNRNYSNSVLHGMHENIKSISQSLSKKFSENSQIGKSELVNVSCISQSPNCIDKKNSEETKNKTKAQTNTNGVKVKIARILKYLNKIISPIFLCIVLITIIFETNLVAILTMFANFGNNPEFSDAKWILVAFGSGGLIGKFCCCKISRTIPEKSHTIGVILFLLFGLSTAGILYSPCLNWLAGFYCILGALEGGISYTVPKCILEYTHTDIHASIYFVKSFLSGVAVICFQYLIGLFPDEFGDKVFLLQTLSCLSVCCSFLFFLLPHLTARSKKQTTVFQRRNENSVIIPKRP